MYGLLVPREHRDESRLFKHQGKRQRSEHPEVMDEAADSDDCPCEAFVVATEAQVQSEIANSQICRTMDCPKKRLHTF